jgi:hypothetical protein
MPPDVASFSPSYTHLVEGVLGQVAQVRSVVRKDFPLHGPVGPDAIEAVHQLVAFEFPSK